MKKPAYSKSSSARAGNDWGPVTEVTFLTSGESPEFGTFEKGDIRTLPLSVAEVLEERGVVKSNITNPLNNEDYEKVAEEKIIPAILKEGSRRYY